MSRTVPLLLLLVFGLLVFLPQTALGQGDAYGGLGGANINFNIINPLQGVVDLPSALGRIVQLMFAFAGIVALIYLIIGGYSYITAAGNPEMQEAAKKTIFNAIIGLVIIIISYLIVEFILNQLDVTVISL